VPSEPASASAYLLELQCGVIARWQAAGAGLDPAIFARRVNSGRWQVLYRGVYAAFTGPPLRLAWLWAAVLRSGQGAALSHFTAAELDGLTDRTRDAIHVSVPASRRVQFGHERVAGTPRIVLHHSNRLSTARHPSRIPPRTRIPETIIDLTQLAGTLDEVVGWLTSGCERRLVTPAQLRLTAANRNRLRWHREIFRVLDDVAAGAHSPLEFRYIRDVERRHGLPAGHRQAPLRLGSRRRYLDNLYHDFGIGVELDGQAAHPAAQRWDDIHRDNSCAVAGVLVLRYGWADVTSRPCAVASEVAALLRQRGWAGRPRRCSPLCPVRSAWPA
jgi:hypothetical protein